MNNKRMSLTWKYDEWVKRYQPIRNENGGIKYFDDPPKVGNNFIWTDTAHDTLVAGESHADACAYIQCLNPWLGEPEDVSYFICDDDTVYDFWECECEDPVLRHISEDTCPVCGMSVIDPLTGKQEASTFVNFRRVRQKEDFNPVVEYDVWRELYQPDETDGALTFYYKANELELRNPEEIRYIWTYLDNDDIVPGFHIVNKVAYLRTRQPWGHQWINVIDTDLKEMREENEDE